MLSINSSLSEFVKNPCYAKRIIEIGDVENQSTLLFCGTNWELLLWTNGSQETNQKGNRFARVDVLANKNCNVPAGSENFFLSGAVIVEAQVTKIFFMPVLKTGGCIVLVKDVESTSGAFYNVSEMFLFSPKHFV